MNIIVNKKMSLPEDKTHHSLNVFILQNEIQKEIWKQDPNCYEVLGREQNGNYYMYILMNESASYPYTRLTIEY